jgi:cell division protein FtsB
MQLSGKDTNLAMRLVLGGLVLAVVYLVFEFGRIQAGYNIVDAVSERKDFRATISGLEAEIKRLNEQIVMLETEAEIESTAYDDVEASLVDLQAKIQEQQDAIAFYRGIVSPADGNAGLRVQDLRLSRTDRERSWNIRLVLVQAMKHDRKVSGDVLITIAGTENGEPRSYMYRDLLPADADGSWVFSFRYFQDFDREVVLPDGFMPEEVTVSVQSRTRSIASIEEIFSWSSHLG